MQRLQRALRRSIIKFNLLPPRWFFVSYHVKRLRVCVRAPVHNYIGQEEFISDKIGEKTGRTATVSVPVAEKDDGTV